MQFARTTDVGTANGIASLAVVKMLLTIMQKKDLLSPEEVDIILNCASAEIDDSHEFGEMVEARMILENMFRDPDYRVATGPGEISHPH